MKQTVKKILAKYALVGFFVFLLCASYQFVIWHNGPDLVDEMLSRMSFSGPDGYQHMKTYLYRELGLDRFFIPHLWIFDGPVVRDN